MSRISTTFTSASSTGRKLLIPFITAGDPVPEFTIPMMHEMVTAGADIIELGVPFSGPMADGPVIQRASERALEQGMSLRKVLKLVSGFREQDKNTPIVLMGYLNPVEAMGYQNFTEAAKSAGVDGVLTVDIPPEEAEEYVSLLKAREIDPIFLLAPNSSDERINKMDAVGNGYLYYVSLKGVTGAGHLDLTEVEKKIQQIKKFTKLPLGVGFGVKDAQTAKSIAQIADAVVVGSALISKIENNPNNLDKAKQEIVDLLASMRQAMDS